MKLECKCGNIIYDISDNQYYKGYIISDKELFDFYDFADEMIETPDADREELAMTFRKGVGVGESYIKLKRIFQCFVCGRIMIQDKNGEYISFSPEEHEEKTILDYGSGSKPEIIHRKIIVDMKICWRIM